MLHGDTINALSAIEARFDVASWAIGGVAVWPILRTSLGFEMLLGDRPSLGQKPTSPLASARKGLAALEGLTDGMRARRPTGPRREHADVVFLSRPTNRHRVGDTWHDRFFDPIADVLEGLGHSQLHLEYRADRTPSRRPTLRPSVPISADILRSLVRAGVGLRRMPSLPGLAELGRYVGEVHPTIRCPSRVWLHLRARAITAIANELERTLVRTAPRIVMMTCWYSVVGMAMSLAASRLGIPTIDVQHGVTQMNPAYEGWSRFPVGGYDLVPDRFWCWTQRDARPIDRWPTDDHVAFAGGHPWMARWQRPYSLTEGLWKDVESMRGDGRNVLVTLTCTSGLSGLLRETIKAAPPSWRWWIRLHPRMTNERAAILEWVETNAAGRAEVNRPTDLPLPVLLKGADVHVTHNSSVVHEAASLGTASVVVDRHALDVYDDALQTGWAVFESTPAAIVDAVRRQTQPDRIRPVLRDYPSWDVVEKAATDLVLGPGSRSSSGVSRASLL